MTPDVRAACQRDATTERWSDGNPVAVVGQKGGEGLAANLHQAVRRRTRTCLTVIPAIPTDSPGDAARRRHYCRRCRPAIRL